MASSSADPGFLSTVQGELAFFHALTQARPIGKHRHFHVLSIRTSISHDTGKHVPIDDIWRKLKECYNIDALEAWDSEAEQLDENNASIPIPTPEENLDNHPYFREEYTLPDDEEINEMLVSRRKRASPSPPSSPPPSPRVKKTRSTSAAGRNKLINAGLVGGDSDSSALTQESGDDNEDERSTRTGTEPPPTEGEDEGQKTTAKPLRGKGAGKGWRKGQGRASAPANRGGTSKSRKKS